MVSKISVSMEEEKKAKLVNAKTASAEIWSSSETFFAKFSNVGNANLNKLSSTPARIAKIAKSLEIFADSNEPRVK